MIQFIRIPLVKPEILGFPDLAYLTGDLVTKESAPDRLYEFLLEGQTEQVRALLIYLYLNGQSVAEICDGPIRQSMSRIGELWRHEEAGIGLEHRATDICLDVLNRIRAIFRPEHDAPIALGGAPPGDPYFLPSLSVAAVLASEGMRSINYGPNTPFEVFYTAIEQYQLALVWLSISYKKHGMKLHGVIEELAAFSNQFGIKLIIGGKEAESIRFPLFSNVQWIASMVELVAFVKGLQANRIEKTH